MRILRRKGDRRRKMRIPIVVKIFGGFTVAIVLMLLSNFIILHRMKTLNDMVIRTGEAVNRVSAERMIMEHINHISKQYIAYLNALSQKHKDPETEKFIRTVPEKIENGLCQICDRIDSLNIPQCSANEELRNLLKNARLYLSDRQYDENLRQTFDAINRCINELLSIEQHRVLELVEQSQKITAGSAKYGIVLSFAMLFLSGIVALIIANRIAKPIANLRKATHFARMGRYNLRVPFTSHDEIADLTADFNAMLDALGKLEKMKSMFLSSITHDLKSPLYRVKLGLENLQDEIIGPLTDEQRKAIQNILNDVDTLSHLIYDILDIQKMESGKFKLELTDVELAPFVREIVKRQAISFSQKGVGLVLRMDIDGVYARIDRTQMERVFENLLSNALKFTPRGGLVTVSVYHKNSLAYFSVSDTGAGIPKDEVERIFDKFYRASTGRNVRGTGLGLAIAKQIIVAHKGRIWAESEPNVGTTFTFVIPTSS